MKLQKTIVFIHRVVQLFQCYEYSTEVLLMYHEFNVTPIKLSE